MLRNNLSTFDTRLSKQVKPCASLINYLRYATVMIDISPISPAVSINYCNSPEFIPAIVTIRIIILVLSKLTIAHENKYSFFLRMSCLVKNLFAYRPVIFNTKEEK